MSLFSYFSRFWLDFVSALSAKTIDSGVPNRSFKAPQNRSPVSDSCPGKPCQ